MSLLDKLKTPRPAPNLESMMKRPMPPQEEPVEDPAIAEQQQAEEKAKEYESIKSQLLQDDDFVFSLLNRIQEEEIAVNDEKTDD